MFEDMVTNMCVNSRQWIIEHVYVGIIVHSPRKCHPLFLSTTKVDTLLSDLCAVP